MPIYDYTCSKCRRVTEVIHGINDHGPKFCPECGATGTMTKAFVAPAVHFKGSGWAKMDRGSSARAARAKDEKAGAGGDATAKSDAGSTSGSDGSSGGSASESGSKTDAGSKATSSGGSPTTSGSSD